jgi:hypothetical protein
MDKHDFVLQQFLALRREIESTKKRLFKTLCLALVIIPGVTFLAELPEIDWVGPLVPFVVLVLTILYVADEHGLMRCGRYVRERIEPLIEEGAGWEAWLESQPHLRQMDKYLLGCFLITLFVFYFGSVGVAITKLWTAEDTAAMTGGGKAIAGGVVYLIGAIWMIITVAHHWRSCTTTTAK